MVAPVVHAPDGHERVDALGQQPHPLVVDAGVEAQGTPVGVLAPGEVPEDRHVQGHERDQDGRRPHALPLASPALCAVRGGGPRQPGHPSGAARHGHGPHGVREVRVDDGARLCERL